MSTNLTQLNFGAVEPAYRWYVRGHPDPQIIPQIDQALLGDLWRGIEAERAEHMEQAAAYASEQIGYRFTPGELISDRAAAHDALRKLRYEELEAGAAIRRVLALAACIRPA